MAFPIAVHVGERLSLEETWTQARFADEQGLDSIWIGEGRLARDGIVPAAVIAYQTSRIKVATGVLSNKSRNAALTAVTAKTLDELAPGRIMLGLGAWWEPLASAVGTPLLRPIQAMREYVHVLRAFFRNEEVTFTGEFVTMRGARFDSMYRENRPVEIPIHLGAVGPRMLELAGQIADGVLLDFLLPTTYLKGALASIEAGATKRSDGRRSIDVYQMVACSVDDTNPRQAIDACKAFLTLYLMQQPHIASHCGADPELVERLKQVAGWPARPDDVRRAMRLVSDDLVHSVAACGTTGQAMAKLSEYHEAGVHCPAISTLGDNQGTLVALAKASR